MNIKTINIKIIKEDIINFFKGFKTFIKETFNLPKAKLYIILAIFLVLVFLVLTFPYAVLIRNYLQNLEKQFGTNITVGSMHIGIIGDSYIDDMVVFLKDGTELDLKDITLDLSLNPITVFARETVKGNFDIKNIKYVKQDTSFSGLIICDLLLKRNSKKGIISEGFINLKIQNVNVQGLTIQDFNIPPVQITAITLDTKINNNEMKIERGIFSGSDLRGNITGKINLSKSLMASRLDLKIEIDKNSKLLVNYKEILGMLGSDKDKIAIEISGSLFNLRPKLPAFKQNEPEEKEEKSEEKPEVKGGEVEKKLPMRRPPIRPR